MIKSILPTAAKVLATLFTGSAIAAPIAWRYIPESQETSEVTTETSSVGTPSTKEEQEPTAEDSVIEETNSPTEQKESSEKDNVVKNERLHNKNIVEDQKDRYEKIKEKLEKYIEKFKDYEEYLHLKNESNVSLNNCLKKIDWEASVFITEVKASLETYEKIKKIKEELDESINIDEVLLNRLDESYNYNVNEHIVEEDESEISGEQKTIEEMINKYKFTKENLNTCISASK